jgi:hypothetical protein
MKGHTTSTSTTRAQARDARGRFVKDGIVSYRKAGWFGQRIESVQVTLNYRPIHNLYYLIWALGTLLGMAGTYIATSKYHL